MLRRLFLLCIRTAFFTAVLFFSAYPCPGATREEKIVQGDSMYPLLKHGDKVIVDYDYYKTHAVRKDDVVLVRYAGNANPLIKVVRALAGDRFGLEKSKGGIGWNIVVNGKILKNSEGNEYLLDDSGVKMLSLYVRDYKGVIPQKAYLVLGDKTSGSLDSTRFGLIGESNIIAKVELPDSVS